MGLLNRLALAWKVLTHRSLENPSTPLSAPDDWLFDALGSYKASSGVNVNRETALTYAALWRGVNLLAKDSGKLPCEVYERVAGGGKKVARNHPSRRVIRSQPNSEMTPLPFRSALMVGALLEGNGYAYIARDGAGRVQETIPLPPHHTYAIRYNGKLWYVYEPTAGPMRKLPAEDVLHIKGLSYDGLSGYNVITKARESLGRGMAMQTYGSTFFRNSARPNVVLKHPKKLTKEAANNLVESWERMRSGLENSHRTALLEEGMDIETMSINARDSQLIEQEKFLLTDVANWLGIPAHKLGGDSNTSYGSLEQENQSYLDEGLDPWLVAWEEEYWSKLLTEEEKRNDTHFVQFNRRALTRANLAARGTYYVQAVTNGWMNQDEIREEEGLDPIPDGAGKDFRAPLNTGVLGEDSNAADGTPVSDKAPDSGGTGGQE